MFFLRSYSRFPIRHVNICARLLSTAAQPAINEEQKHETQKKQETNSFVMNIFKGQFKGEQIFPYPHVLSEEQEENMKMMLDPVERFFKEVNNPVKNDETENIDEQTVQALRELGAFGLLIPQKYGGLGLCNSQYARLGEVIGMNDMGVGIFIGAHQSIGLKGILLYGNEEQKEKYLPDLAAGRKFAAYCLTEPGHGSDASSIKTRAELSPDGKHYVMNGSKIWITNGGIADIFTVFAQTPVDTPKGKKDKITAFVVERAFKGVTSGPPEKKLGIKASNTAELFFDNVKIPVENVLGEVGEGFKVAMNILNSGRFGMAAVMTGVMRKAIEKAVDHATTRVQFGNKICTYGTIQEKLARMAMKHYITMSMTYAVSGLLDQEIKDCQLEAAISKVFGSESAWYVVDEAIQVLGGMGFMKEAGLEKMLRDLRIFRIFEGTNDILKLFVALTGLQYAGGHLKELQNAMKNPAANLGLILDEGVKRMKQAVGLSSNISINEFVHPNLHSSTNLVGRSIEQFGSSVEYLLMKYKKNIINEQFLLNRLAVSAVDIYSMIVVLSKCSQTLEKNLPSSQHEEALTKLICSEAAERVQLELSTLKKGEKLDNFKTMASISEDLCKNGTVCAYPALGF
ncbi:very long-chain specific acyl-CoA dehydrogenase, mitochondrial [Centruroides vittatus]|uniref:very long-chain specific acyl-CoA dehydrogenase, mitochondrial n=1 Tax=Centruroides vittatus TaxID=120091 RepID=UPI00350FDFD7